MKVAVLHDREDLRLDEVPRPAVGPGDLLIKVAAAGICGTDLHFRHMGPRFAGRPMPLGHEFAGEVVEIGSGVTSFRVGDRVAYNSNNSPADMGRGGECGGFSHYVVLREVDGHVQSLCRVPDNVSFDHAALVEPISVGTHAVNRANPGPGESVTLFGSGPIGLGIIMTLIGRGIDDIIVFDLSPLRRERAMALGARAAFDPRENPPEEILGELRGHGTDLGRSPPKDRHLFRGERCARPARGDCPLLQQGKPDNHHCRASATGNPRWHENHEQGDQSDRIAGLSGGIPRGNGQDRERGNRSGKDDHASLSFRQFSGSL